MPKVLSAYPFLWMRKPVAAVLAISPEPMPRLTEEDQQTYFQNFQPGFHHPAKHQPADRDPPAPA